MAAGQSIALNGSGSDPDGDALTFAWDLDGDLLYETSGQHPTFSAAGLPPGTVRTVRVSVIDPSGAYGLASTTIIVTGGGAPPFPTLAPSACSPRPLINLQVDPAGGRLRVTVSTSTDTATPGNHLTGIQFGTAPNTVAEDTSGQSPPPSRPTGATSYQFFVRRTGPGGVSLPFTVSDTCGPWPSFAGGGPSAF